MSKNSPKSRISVEPLFSDLDRRRLIPLAEAADITGWSRDQLRLYAINGTIPGARQAAWHKPWYFDRLLLEKWWQEFNAAKPGERLLK